MLGIDLKKTPTSMMEEEVNYEEAVKILENHSGHEEVHVEMTPDAISDDAGEKLFICGTLPLVVENHIVYQLLCIMVG